eukprot:g4220.t1
MEQQVEWGAVARALESVSANSTVCCERCLNGTVQGTAVGEDGFWDFAFSNLDGFIILTIGCSLAYIVGLIVTITLLFNQNKRYGPLNKALPWEAVSKTLQTGDILLLRSTRWSSPIIQAGQLLGAAPGTHRWGAVQGSWTHVGFIVRTTSKRILMLECTTNHAGVPDADGVVRKAQIQLVEAHARVSSKYSNGQAAYSACAVRKLKRIQLQHEDRLTLRQFIESRVGVPYEGDVVRLVFSVCDWLPCCVNTEDPSSMICSELVAECMKSLGLISPDTISAEISPNDFSRDAVQLERGGHFSRLQHVDTAQLHEEGRVQSLSLDVFVIFLLVSLCQGMATASSYVRKNTVGEAVGFSVLFLALPLFMQIAFGAFIDCQKCSKRDTSPIFIAGGLLVMLMNGAILGWVRPSSGTPLNTLCYVFLYIAIAMFGAAVDGYAIRIVPGKAEGAAAAADAAGGGAGMLAGIILVAGATNFGNAYDAKIATCGKPEEASGHSGAPSVPWDIDVTLGPVLTVVAIAAVVPLLLLIFAPQTQQRRKGSGEARSVVIDGLLGLLKKRKCIELMVTSCLGFLVIGVIKEAAGPYVLCQQRSSLEGAFGSFTSLVAGFILGAILTGLLCDSNLLGNETSYASAASLLGMLLPCIIFSVSPSVSMVAEVATLSSFVGGFGAGGFTASARATMITLGERDSAATFGAVMALLFNGSNAAGKYIGGALVSNGLYDAPFYVSVIFCTIALSFIVLFHYRHGKGSHRHFLRGAADDAHGEERPLFEENDGGEAGDQKGSEEETAVDDTHGEEAEEETGKGSATTMHVFDNDDIEVDRPSEISRIADELKASELMETAEKLEASHRLEVEHKKQNASAGLESRLLGRREEIDRRLKQTKLLQSTDVFSSLDEEAIDAVIRAMRLKRYSKNNAVCVEGHIAKSFYVIISGELQVIGKHEDGSTEKLSKMKTMECFGEIALMDSDDESKLRSATVVVCSDNAELLVLGVKKFRELREAGVIPESTTKSIKDRAEKFKKEEEKRVNEITMHDQSFEGMV